MDTITPTDPKARELRSAARVNVEDESVQVFLPESGRCEVVIATLDKHGRPKTVARWVPGSPEFASSRSLS